jgi:hypothetical protein
VPDRLLAQEISTYIDVYCSISLHRASFQQRWHFGSFEVNPFDAERDLVSSESFIEPDQCGGRNF